MYVSWNTAASIIQSRKSHEHSWKAQQCFQGNTAGGNLIATLPRLSIAANDAVTIGNETTGIRLPMGNGGKREGQIECGAPAASSSRLPAHSAGTVRAEWDRDL